jgi:hypothetical protein
VNKSHHLLLDHLRLNEQLLLLSLLQQVSGFAFASKRPNNLLCHWHSPTSYFLRRCPPSAAALVKNTILGIVVFDGYDKIMEELTSRTVTADQQKSDGEDDHVINALDPQEVHSYNPIAIASVPVPQHFVAGAAAGSLHSMLTVFFDSLQSRSLPTLRNCCYVTLHHSFAHSILFGSYEWAKRFLGQRPNDNYALGFTQLKDDDDDDDDSSVRWNQLAVTAIAGGTAGILQSCVSHYTGMWFGVETTERSYHQIDILSGAEKKKMNSQPSTLDSLGLKARSIQRMFLPLPPVRSTLITFPVMSIAFLAYEYAKDF